MGHAATGGGRYGGGQRGAGGWEKRTDELAVAAGETSKVDLLPAPTVAAPVVEKREDGCPKQEKVVATKGTVKQTTVGYAAGGVGVAGLLTFTLFGILDNKKFNDVESGCTGLVCPSALADDAERGRSYQALANVGLGVGLAGIGTGAILLLTAPREQNTSARRSRTQLLVGPGTVNVKGAF